MSFNYPQHTLKSLRFFPLLLCIFFFQANIFASHADLELTMTSPNSNPGVFGYVDIEITLTNHGPEATNNVLLEFPFPTDLPIAGDPVESQGLFSNWWTGTGTWTVGTLASGQTETVTLSLFTLTEDLFFYGQVVNSSVVDNDSSPDNGTPPTVNEDDEAVVVINETGGGDCELTVLVSNIVCDDFNTPNLDYDDIFTFDVTVTGQNTSGNWIAEVPNPPFPPTQITGAIGGSVTLAFNIAEVNDFMGGVVNFAVQDANDSSCSDDVSVIAPPPCSPGSDCNISGAVSGIQCHNSGTIDNPDDDNFSFDLLVTGANTGANWIAVINNQTYNGSYNINTSIGLFPISDGDIFVALMDSNNPSCVDGFTVNAPAPCSDAVCVINSQGIGQFCDDNGTPNDPSDDVWFAEINPVGNNLGSTFSIVGDIDGDNLPYGQDYIFGPYPIQPFFERNFTIIDDDNGCTAGFILDATATCSNGGNDADLQLTMTSNDVPGSFQNVSFELTVTNTGTEAASAVDIFIPDPVGMVLQGSNPYSATAGIINGFSDALWSFSSIAPGQTEVMTINYFTLTTDAVTCYAQVSGMSNADADSTPNNGTPPVPNEDDEAAYTLGSITNCVISGPAYSNINCFNNGTSTIDDDYFNFDIVVSGNGTSFQLTTNAGVNGVFNYGDVIAITDFAFADMPFQATSVDVNNASCMAVANETFQPCSNGGNTDLSISLSSSDTIIATGSIFHTVTVTNNGINAAEGVSMQVYLNGAVGIIDESISKGSFSNQTELWTIGTIPAGQSETIVLDEYYLDFGFSMSPSITFFEILTMDGNDPDSTPGNDNGDFTADEDDEARAETIPGGDSGIPYDLSVSLTAQTTTVDVGEPFLFIFTINHDIYAIDEIVASLDLPSTIQIQSINTSQGAFNQNTGIWTVGHLYGSNPTATLEVSAILLDDSQPSNIFGQIESTINPNLDFDSPHGNGMCCVANEDDESVLMISGGNLQLSDLVSITASAEVLPGGTMIDVDWTIINNGNINSVAFINRLYFSTDDQLSNNDPNIAGSFNNAVTPIVPGGSYTPNLADLFLPSGTAPGNYFIIFEVDSDDSNNELNESNNVIAFPITVPNIGSGPDLELDVTSNSTYQAWGFMSFEINLTNNGTDPATGVKVQVFEIQGGIYQGGNEGDATAGVFNGTNAGASFWDLTGVTIAPGQTEVLTINCFMYNDGGIQTWAQVWEQTETDIDSAPGNGFPFSIQEDDEDSGLLTADGFTMIGQISNQLEAQYLDSKMLIQNVYPNPTKDDLKIEMIAVEEGEAILKISNMQGRYLKSIEKQIPQGRTMIEMNVADLPKGIYFITIESESGREVRRFLKN